MDLIERQAAIDALRVAYWDDNIQSAKDDPCIVDAMTDWAIRQVKALSSVQPERKKGKWITETINSYTKRTYCSLCDEEAPFIFKKDDKYNYWYHESKLTNFCPNCGSDMRGEQK